MKTAKNTMKRTKKGANVVPADPPKATAATVLVLRCCAPDLTAHGGFRWPESGPVAAPDWSPAAECGHGLHGWLWGEGDASASKYVDTPDAKWLVVQVEADKIVHIDRKVKFPAGIVVHCGDRQSATGFIMANGAAGRAVIGATLTGGDGATLTGGYGATLTGGDRSTLTGGYGATLVFRFWDHAQKRTRLVCAEVGPDEACKPGIPYRLDENHQIKEAGGSR